MDNFNIALKSFRDNIKDISTSLQHIYKQVPQSHIPSNLKEAHAHLSVLNENINSKPKEPAFPIISFKNKRSKTSDVAPNIVPEPLTHRLTTATREKFHLFSANQRFARLHSNQKYRRPKFSRISHSRPVPKHTRYDPIANPIDITAEEQELGIFNITNMGLIRKDANLDSFFELPSLQSKKVTLNTFSSQFQSPVSERKIFTTAVETCVKHKRTDANSPDLIRIEEITSPIGNKRMNNVMETVEKYYLIVKRGKFNTTADFESFRKTYKNKWRTMDEVLTQTEALCKKLRYPKVILDGKKLYDLEVDEVRPLTISKLHSCILNHLEAKSTIKLHKIIYRGKAGRHLAALKIQTAFRCYYAARQYRHLRALNIKAKIIQLYFRLYLKKLETKKNISLVRKERISKFTNRIEQFKQNWGKIKKSYRTEIHLGTLQPDKTCNFYYAKQNSQLMRVFALADPLLSIIYISPVDLHNDITEYYYSVLTLCNIPNVRSRLKFLTPNHGLNMENLYSTSKLLFLASKTINEIKDMIKGKIAYIVPNIPCEDDIWLSDLLDIPTMCTEPGLASCISTKTGCVPIFKSIDIKTPLQISHIKTPDEFYNTLSRLIYEHLDKDIWLFKINHETKSRGLAFFDTTKLKSVMKYRKYDVIKEEYLIEIHTELVKVLPISVKLVMITLWESWHSFLHAFCLYGGIIEETPHSRNNIASPCISICIEPDGGIVYLCAVDRMQSRDYFNAGVYYPQSSLPHGEILEIGWKIGKELYKNGVIGYAVIELVAFPDPYVDGGLPVYWGIDIRLNLGIITSAYFMFNVLVGGFVEGSSGKYYIEFEEHEDEFAVVEDLFGDDFTNFLTTTKPMRMRNEYILNKVINDQDQEEDKNVEDFNKFDERCFLFCWHVEHPDLSDLSIGGLFHMTRLESMTYSIETCKGAAFTIYEKLTNYHFGIMGIGNNRQDSIRVLSETFSFILQQAGPPPQPPSSFKPPPCEDYNLNELITKVKSVHKTLEKINKTGKKNYLVELL
ncbi:hypothetical protein SteCoe_5482 [Stentor coeruleus]|uniref:IQCH-like ATP-grasp domain-containing protein n=1 Tax=Stentor coeruleus TaxID=5963 RepID=A0A1R2CSG9_9CILI|nr:hypothetical protein SteCoe_5482 [Stentor coeruleus]